VEKKSPQRQDFTPDVWYVEWMKEGKKDGGKKGHSFATPLACWLSHIYT